jgi:hypothetical protein
MTTRITATDWLLASDPSIRWQLQHDLTDASTSEVAGERARVATQGWGAQLLNLQHPDGLWRDGGSLPDWTFLTLQSLLLLRDLGLAPASPEARRAVGLVRANVRWVGVLPQDASWHGRPFFAGEVEPCINGRVVAVGAYFGQDVQDVVDRLLGEQMADGGWNCEDDNGSTRGSFNSTICVLEGLLEHDRATGGSSADLLEALRRGHEYLLERSLFRRLSTGDLIDPRFSRFGFPTCYHYDVLRGLDHLRDAGVAPDERMDDAIALVRSKADIDGRWHLDHRHEGSPVVIGEEEGMPSGWITLRALRVLDWYEAGRATSRLPAASAAG